MTKTDQRTETEKGQDTVTENRKTPANHPDRTTEVLKVHIRRFATKEHYKVKTVGRDKALQSEQTGFQAVTCDSNVYRIQNLSKMPLSHKRKTKVPYQSASVEQACVMQFVRKFSKFRCYRPFQQTWHLPFFGLQLQPTLKSTDPWQAIGVESWHQTYLFLEVNQHIPSLEWLGQTVTRVLKSRDVLKQKSLFLHQHLNVLRTKFYVPDASQQPFHWAYADRGRRVVAQNQLVSPCCTLRGSQNGQRNPIQNGFQQHS